MSAIFIARLNIKKIEFISGAVLIMFDLRKILMPIRYNEINSLNFSNQSCVDYSQKPTQKTLELSEISGSYPSYLWKIVGLSDNRIAISVVEKIYIFNIDEGRCEAIFRSHNNSEVTDLLCLLDGSLLSSHEDGTVKIWNIYSGMLLGNLLKIECSIQCMEMLSNNCIVCGGVDGNIYIIYLNLGYIIFPVLPKHISPIFNIAHYEGAWIVGVDNNDYLSLTSINKEANRFFIKIDSKIHAICVDLFGNLLFGSDEGFINSLIFSKAKSSFISKALLKISSEYVYAIENLPDGNIIASSGESILCILNRQKNGILQAINISPPSYIKRLVVLEDGRIIINNVDKNIIVLEFPKRAVKLDDLWLILLSLEKNNSVSTINLSDIDTEGTDQNTYDELRTLKENRKNLNIIGSHNLNNIINK